MTLKKQDCLTLDDVSSLLNISRGTLYKYMKHLGIKATKFQFDKKLYVTLEDIEKLKQFLQEIS